MSIMLMNDPAAEAASHIERLYEEYQRPLLAYLKRLVSDHEAAEDLCQDTFAKALQRWEQHNAQSNVVAWLYRIATNNAYDHLRRRRRRILTRLIELEAFPTATSAPESRLAESEPVRAALARIPPQYRVPLLLTSQGHSTEEIAAALGCSCLAVKMRLFRARERFRRVYRGDA
jgi:RNA polymerase sigma-70 factor (ECF subfamily)